MNNIPVRIFRGLRQGRTLRIFVCSAVFILLSFFCACAHYLFPSIDNDVSLSLRETDGVVTRTFYADPVGMQSPQYTLTADVQVDGFVFDLFFALGFTLNCNLMQPELSGVYSYDSSSGRGTLIEPIDLGLEVVDSARLGEFRYASKLRLRIEVDGSSGRADFFVDGKKRGTFLNSAPLVHTSEFIVKEDTFLRISRFIVEDGGKTVFDFSLKPKSLYEVFVLYRKPAGVGLLVLGLLGLLVGAAAHTGFLRIAALLAVFISAEVFLRIAEPANPRFNMDALIALQDYNFYVLTNLVRNRQIQKDGRIVITDVATYPAKEEVFSVGPERAEKLTVLCLGASPAEGHDINPGFVFSDVLARLIGGSTESINAATPNFSLDSVAYALHFRDVLMWTRADIIVIFASFAPVPVAADVRSFNRYRKIHELLKRFPGWINSPRRAYCALEFRNPSVPLVVSYEFLSRSFLFFGLEQWRKRIFNYFVSDVGTGTDEKPHQKILEDFWSDTLRLYPELFPDAPVPVPASLLHAVRELAVRQNPYVKIILVPEPYTDVPFGDEDVERMFYEMVERTVTEMTRLADDYGNVVMLDLQPRLGNSSEPVFSDMTHLNELGHDIIAREIFEKLRSFRKSFYSQHSD